MVLTVAFGMHKYYTVAPKKWKKRVVSEPKFMKCSANNFTFLTLLFLKLSDSEN
jgi:hypothetical protein